MDILEDVAFVPAKTVASTVSVARMVRMRSVKIRRRARQLVKKALSEERQITRIKVDDLGLQYAWPKRYDAYERYYLFRLSLTLDGSTDEHPYPPVSFFLRRWFSPKALLRMNLEHVLQEV